MSISEQSGMEKERKERAYQHAAANAPRRVQRGAFFLKTRQFSGDQARFCLEGVLENDFC